MEGTSVTLVGQVCWVSRGGYTGEDGYEISVPEEAAEELARLLLDDALLLEGTVKDPAAIGRRLQALLQKASESALGV